jgi:hypothetical protein
MAEIGPMVVDLIGDEIDAKGLGDLQFGIDIPVSVRAHYLAGTALLCAPIPLRLK